MEPHCPICRCKSSLWTEIRGYPLFDCNECTHRFTVPTEPISHIDSVYDDAYFFGGGAGYSDYLKEESILRERGRSYATLATKKIGRPGTVIDIGAAAGFLLSGWIEAKWNGIGVEPNASMTEHAKTRGIDVRCGAFENADLNGVSNVDCVSMIQVISHFIDPTAAITRAYQLLRPGGYLLVETWDRKSIIARVMNSKWHEYSPPSVLHWYTRTSLSRLVSNAGFDAGSIEFGRVFRWIGVEHARSLLDHMATKSRAAAIAKSSLAVVPSRLALPYPGDDLFWMCCKKPS